MKFGQGLREKISEKKARKWMWFGLLAFVALQIYFVQEMLAALALFTGLFVILALVALGLYLVERVSQWGLSWAGQHAGPAVELARRGLATAEAIGKKTFSRPLSETAK